MPFNFFSPISEDLVLAEIARVEAEFRSNGDLSMRLDSSIGNASTRAVIEAFNGLLKAAAQPVEDLAANIAEMAAEHDRGDIDVLIPTDRFSGRYREMAHGINDLRGWAQEGACHA